MISGCGRAVLRTESKMKILTFSMVCFASVVLADDFKTIDGKEYKNVTVRRVEPDGIVLTTSVGISKVYFTELPKDVQERFHYDPEKAAAANAAQQAANRQADELARQADELNKQRKQEQQRQSGSGQNNKQNRAISRRWQTA